MKIYTKLGDQGQTSLYSGERVFKTDVRIHTLGHIDELTSHLGKAKSIILDQRVKQDIERIQTNLIKFMGIVASNGNSDIDFPQGEVQWLEDRIDLYNKEYTHPGKFILPGENIVSAQVDVTRTIARRAERSLLECTNIPIGLRKYANRLSDYLYAVGRMIDAGVGKENAVGNSKMNHIILLEEAKNLTHLIEQYAEYQGRNVCIAITNSSGNPICVHAMDNALMISFELAIKKAYTAAALQMPTHELAKLTEVGAPFFGLENMVDKQIITIGGGVPLKKDGRLIGAIGISGGSAEEDVDIATYGQYIWKGE